MTGPVVIDSREAVPGALFAALPGERVDGRDFAAVAAKAGAVAVLSHRPIPDVHDVPVIVTADVTVALGALAREVLRRLPSATVIGITGSSGKTSTKDLTAQVVDRLGPTIAPVGSFNNELGLPLTVLRADAVTRYLVLEMSARGIGHIAQLCDIAPPRIGAVLNVGRAHAGRVRLARRGRQGQGRAGRGAAGRRGRDPQRRRPQRRRDGRPHPGADQPVQRLGGPHGRPDGRRARRRHQPRRPRPGLVPDDRARAAAPTCTCGCTAATTSPTRWPPPRSRPSSAWTSPPSPTR